MEENFKGYTSHLGEWISWTYQKDEGRDFFNPLICIATTCYDTICEVIKILVKGKSYVVKFVEINNKEILQGKTNSMQDNCSTEQFHHSDEIKMRELEVLEEPSKEKELHASTINLSPFNGKHKSLDRPEVNLSIDGRTGDALSKLSNNNLSRDQETSLQNSVVNASPLSFRNMPDDSSSLIRTEFPQDKIISSPSPQVSEEGLWDSSSKGSLCLEIGNLRVKGAAGRPKKNSRKKKNPFDFANLGVKRGCKKASSSRPLKVPFRLPCKRKGLAKLETIQENLVVNNEEKAKSIINCAQMIGLQVNSNITDAIKGISQELKEGNL